MNKYECNVVRDLMPLVLDRAASDESREIVENHIVSCEECRKQYDAMKSELPEDTRAEYEEEQRQFTEALRTLRKNKLKRRILAAVLSIILCVAAGFGGLLAYDRLVWKQTVTVDNSLYTLSLAQLADGRIVVTADSYGISFDTSTQVNDYLEDGKTVSYCCFKCAPIHPSEPIVSGEQRMGTKREMMVYGSNGKQKISEIRQGDPGSYVTIWKEGETIPAASEEMEAYFALEDKHMEWLDSLPSTEDGKVQVDWEEAFAMEDRMDEARMAVPEWQ